MAANPNGPWTIEIGDTRRLEIIDGLETVLSKYIAGLEYQWRKAEATESHDDEDIEWLEGQIDDLRTFIEELRNLPNV